MPNDSSTNLASRVKSLEDAMQMHRHTGFDNSSQLLNTPISQARLVNAATLGDGIGKSGTLDLRLAPNKGDVYIKANLNAGDFANAGNKTGFIIGLDDSDSDKVKFYFGSPTQYIKYDGATLSIVGNLSASSIDIPDTVTASSFHVDSLGNTWWGATTLAASLANVTAAGVGTFAGLYTINKKAFTNFETSTRFVSSPVGSGAATFGNQGVTIDPGATNSSSEKLLWRIGNVFTNNPMFTATIIMNSLNIASGSMRGFIGLGQPAIDGTHLTLTGVDHIGFYLVKESGVCTISSSVGTTGAGPVGNTFLSGLANNDVIELFLKVTASSVKWYYRKNGGTLTLGDTQTTDIPTGTAEDSVCFGITNLGTSVACSIILQGAGYEH